MANAKKAVAAAPTRFLLVDPLGIILDDFGGTGAMSPGLHYRSTPGLPGECRHALDQLLPVKPGEFPRAVVSVEGELLQIRVLEVIRVNRRAFDLKRALAEWLFSMAERSFEANIRLVIRLEKSFPPEVMVDPEKLLWVVKTITQNALHSVARGTFFRHGGKVEISLGYDRERAMLRISVEHDGGKSTELCLDQASFHGPAGRMNGAGQFARLIIEAHGGTMDWRAVRFAEGDKVGTRVSLEIPTQIERPSL